MNKSFFAILILLFLAGNRFFCCDVSAQNDDRLHLIHSDILYKNESDTRANILVGNVKLSHGNMVLDCDSARYYMDVNSFDAFGHVKIVQGDTLTMTCDTLYYDGTERVLNARGKVVLINKNSRLETTKLDYNRREGVGMYRDGGTLYDGESVLTSDYGEYTPSTHTAFFITNVTLTNNGADVTSDSLDYRTDTKDAFFSGNVKLKNDKYDVISNSIYYNTDSEIAKIVSPTNILSTDGTFIYSYDGLYDMKEDNATLLKGSYIIQDDRRIDADSLHYEKENGICEAFNNVVINDEANLVMLKGNYCWYNKLDGNALATDSAVVVDYSEADTMYMHADTLKLFTFNNETDSVHRVLHAYNKVRMFRNDVQAVCDSLVSIERDSCTYLYGQPIVWQDNQQIFGEEIRVYNNDSTLDWIHIVNQAMTIEKLDSVSFNQVSSHEMKSYFNNKQIERNEAHGNVIVDYFFDDDDGTRIGMNYSESTDLTIFMKDKKIDKIWMPATSGTMFPPDKIPLSKRYLDNFAWFDYIRPLNKEDIFRWQSKDKEHMLKNSEERSAPIQSLKSIAGE